MQLSSNIKEKTYFEQIFGLSPGLKLRWHPLGEKPGSTPEVVYSAAFPCNCPGRELHLLLKVAICMQCRRKRPGAGGQPAKRAGVWGQLTQEDSKPSTFRYLFLNASSWNRSWPEAMLGSIVLRLAGHLMQSLVPKCATMGATNLDYGAAMFFCCPGKDMWLRHNGGHQKEHGLVYVGQLPRQGVSELSIGIQEGVGGGPWATGWTHVTAWHHESLHWQQIDEERKFRTSKGLHWLALMVKWCLKPFHGWVGWLKT